MLSPGHVKGPSSKTHLPQPRPADHRGVCLWEGGQEGTQAPQGWVSGHTRWQVTLRTEQGAVAVAVGSRSPAKGWGHLVTPVAPCVPTGPCCPPSSGEPGCIPWPRGGGLGGGEGAGSQINGN